MGYFAKFAEMLRDLFGRYKGNGREEQIVEIIPEILCVQKIYQHSPEGVRVSDDMANGFSFWIVISAKIK